MTTLPTMLSGQEMRALRHEHGLTQAQLADMLGYSVRMLRAWESDARPIPDAVADQLPVRIREHYRTRYAARRSIEERLRRLSLAHPGDSLSLAG
jgi:transcriptional regulator with XRE-family HTH domain